MIIRKRVQQEYFQAVEDGRKRFEVRLADFKSKPEDTLILEEQGEKNKLTGRKIECEVLYTFMGLSCWPLEGNIDIVNYTIE